MSRILDILYEIEELIDNSKTAPLSKGKILVDKDNLLDLLEDLKEAEPEEIKQYQRVISNRDSILSQANAQSTKLLEDAKEKARQMVDEHDIMQKAYDNARKLMEDTKEQCDQMITHAEEQANALRAETIRYIDEVLANVSSTISYSMRDAQDRFNGMMNSLNMSATTLEENREQLLQMNQEVMDQNQ